MALDIKSLVSQALKTVSGIVDNATETITYRRSIADPTYDTTTGPSYSYSNFTIERAIRTKLTNEDKLNTDSLPDTIYSALNKIYLISSLDLGFEPSLLDKVVIDNKEYDLIGFSSIPTDSLYKIIIRRP